MAKKTKYEDTWSLNESADLSVGFPLGGLCTFSVTLTKKGKTERGALHLHISHLNQDVQRTANCLTVTQMLYKQDRIIHVIPVF